MRFSIFTTSLVGILTLALPALGISLPTMTAKHRLQPTILPLYDSTSPHLEMVINNPAKNVLHTSPSSSSDAASIKQVIGQTAQSDGHQLLVTGPSTHHTMQKKWMDQDGRERLNVEGPGVRDHDLNVASPHHGNVKRCVDS